ncbi:hypothetical protein QEO94_03265 [Kingella negevensis]|nr:hypothetical protein [Kingella negevensis]WII93836.1 hypothetical protein QEO94_03265 [Kingella negevensis]
MIFHYHDVFSAQMRDYYVENTRKVRTLLAFSPCIRAFGRKIQLAK